MENVFSVENLTFSDSPRPDTKDVIFGAGELGIQVKIITGDHVAIAKETCRLIGVGRFPRPRIPQRMRPTRFVIDLESLWKVATVLLEFIRNTSSRLFRC